MDDIQVDIDFFQPNVVTAEKVLKEMERRYKQAIADLKWARKKQRSGGFSTGDAPALGRLVGALVTLGGAPEIAYKETRKNLIVTP